MSLRRETLRIDPRLGGLLSDLDGSPLQQALADRVAQLAAEAGPSPSGMSLAEALRPHRWLLEHLGDQGLTLTGAGYLKPAEVRSLAAELPTMSDWIFPITYEIHAHPVLGFREHLRAVGLLRKAKGVLYATKLGKDALRDSALLWRHLSVSLVPHRSAYEETAGLLLLIHMATSPDRIGLGIIARTLTDLGWSRADGSPLTDRDIYPIWNPLWDAIGAVGPRDEVARDRTPSAAAVALIRDALLTPTSIAGASA